MFSVLFPNRLENLTYIYNSTINSLVFEMQTVVCFPYLGGVIELGVTEMVMFFVLVFSLEFNYL